MASSINASTSGAGGVVTTADSSGVLQLQTGGTTAVTVDASQNVGIGTSSPTYNFHVKETDGATSISSLFETTVAGGSYISFKDPNTAQPYNVRVGSVGENLAFQTSSAERMRITSNGGVSFGSSGTAYGTSGQVLVSNGDAAPTWGSAAPTTAQVQSAMAGSALGDIGTYALMQNTTANSAFTAGTNYAGSGLRYTGFSAANTSGGSFNSGGQSGTVPSGTWKAMGYAAATGAGWYTATVFLRVA